MKYFTAEEARAILDNNSVLLCMVWDSNPGKEAARVLSDEVQRRPTESWSAAVRGFLLGRATGIREERQRRKGAAV